MCPGSEYFNLVWPGIALGGSFGTVKALFNSPCLIKQAYWFNSF